jgi:hypothetical protein
MIGERICKRRRIGLQILVSVVTLGCYGVYWAYSCHEEIKQYSQEGLGGVVGALVYVFAGVLSWFLLPLEIKRMYEQDGQPSPVGATTAFWVLLFGVPWYVKCQVALNDFWASKGAPEPSGI